MYAEGEYDLAGFAVGVVARKKLVDGTRVGKGDVAIGLPSSGLHSNGYSLARKVVLEAMKLSYDERPDVLGGKTVGEALLAPTRLYARHVAAVLQSVDVHAMSHITGGGIPGNLPRVLPEGLGVRIGARWPRPPIFELVQRGGGISESEMRRTFNGGMGFLFVVDARQAERTRAVLGALGETPVTVGEVIRVPLDRAFEDRVEWPE
jgi:phosphoribosylformylglycinamidine cyclo-ligase